MSKESNEWSYWRWTLNLKLEVEAGVRSRELGLVRPQVHCSLDAANPLYRRFQAMAEVVGISGKYLYMYMIYARTQPLPEQC